MQENALSKPRLKTAVYIISRKIFEEPKSKTHCRILSSLISNITPEKQSVTSHLWHKYIEQLLKLKSTRKYKYHILVLKKI